MSGSAEGEDRRGEKGGWREKERERKGGGSGSAPSLKLSTDIAWLLLGCE